MIITLTDIDGIVFDVDTDYIESVTRSSYTTIILKTGEKIKCRDKFITIASAIVKGYFTKENNYV